MNENENNIKFFDIDINNAYCYARNRKSMKLKFFQIRKYFVYHNTKFILFKILIGLLIFALPIFLFKQIINSKNTMTSEVSSYVSAAMPLVASIIIFLTFLLCLIVIKCLMLCRNRL